MCTLQSKAIQEPSHPETVPVNTQTVLPNEQTPHELHGLMLPGTSSYPGQFSHPQVSLPCTDGIIFQ